MLRKRLSLFIVVAMLLSIFVPTAYAYDIADAYHGSDRAYDVQDITLDIEEYKNPFGAVQASDDVETDRTVSLQSEFVLQSSLLPEVDKTTGSAMYAHLYHLSETIGTRRANTPQEEEARDYIYNVFEDLGYSPIIQHFTYQSTGKSSNVIAVKEGRSSKEIIVGAHYDSVSTKGASDNASGVAVMLGAAEILADVQTDYTIKFIAFGAEEAGLQGSKYFTSQMTEDDIANTLAMINLDTVLVGDYKYVYGSPGEAGWVRDKALALAKALDLDVITQKGLNPKYPAGTTGDWSDHAPFKNLGIPFLYFESTNWNIQYDDGSYSEGEQETVEYTIMHTQKDNLAFLHNVFPGRIEDRLYTYTTLLSNLLVNITPPVQKTGINVSTNLLSLSEAREVEVAVTLGYVPDLDNLEWTFGTKPFEDWKSFKSGSYTGNPFIYFVVDPYVDGDTIRATIKWDLPYGTTNLQGRPYPRTAYPALLGEYNLAVTDITTDVSVKTAMRLNAYDSYRTYDEIKPEVERIINLAKSDRYIEYEALGYSAEGREIPFVMFARSKADIDEYLEETLPMMLENPDIFINKIENGFDDYKPAIWFNNVHSDEANGSDAQLDILRKLATEDTITFKRAVNNQDKSELETVTLDVQEILDNFIILFNINNNPDGMVYNTRATVAGFDPNRDPSYQTQIEMVHVMEGVGKWTPMILNDFHGFVPAFLIEPCTPPHDPNFEYDLLMDGMINHAHAMGKAGIANTKYNNYIIPMFDYADGWDDGGPMYVPVAAMLHGTMGHTIEIPELNQESTNAFMYAGFGSLKHALENKERLFLNQLNIYKRGIEGLDDRAVDEWFINAEGKAIGRPRGDKENFFPEYFIIPVDKTLQKNQLAAYEMVQYLIRNSLKVEKTTTPVTVDGINYPIGTFVVPMRQAKRGLVNSLLYDGSDFSDWGAMYAEVTMNFPHLRGFDKYESREAGVFDGVTQRVEKVDIPATNIPWDVDKIVIRNTNNDVIKAVNELLAKDKLVQMTYSDGEAFNKGDFVVAKKDLETVKNKYYLELAPYIEEADLKVLKQPNVMAVGSELIFVLEGLGFNLVDSYNEADIIVDASSSSLSTTVRNLIQGGTSYIGIGGNPINAVANSGLLTGLSRGRTGGSHEGVLRAVINTDSVITGGYSENDFLYNKSGSWMETVPATSTVLATLKDSEDFYVAGWWPGHESAQGKPYIIQDKIGEATITLFANHITNRAHPAHQFRMLANAIYDGAPGVDEYGFGIKFIDPKLTFKLGGDADVTVEITNNTKETEDVTLIVALYNKTNNMMVNYSYINTSFNPGESGRITTGFRIPSAGNYKVKAFIWDNWTNARPLSDVLEIGVIK